MMWFTTKLEDWIIIYLKKWHCTIQILEAWPMTMTMTRPNSAPEKKQHDVAERLVSFLRFAAPHMTSQTSQELRMLSWSLSDCKSLLLNVMKVSQKSHKRLSIVSQKSHKSLPKVSQKSLKSVSTVSPKSLKRLSKVSQKSRKSLNWNQKSDRLTHYKVTYWAVLDS